MLTGLGGLEGFLGSKMPLDGIKIDLNSAEKFAVLSLRIPLESLFGNPILQLQIAGT